MEGNLLRNLYLHFDIFYTKIVENYVVCSICTNNF